MKASLHSCSRKFFMALLLATLFNTAQLQAGGVTMITHGLEGNVDDWVTAMGEQVKGYYRFAGTNYSCYKMYFVPSGSSYYLTSTRLHGSQPSATDSGEIIVLLDWSQLAEIDLLSMFTTYDIAPVVVRCMLLTNFISELNGHALAEMPIHLIGHSRGGSLMCQISQLLGTNGVWVDHLTTLDPHPLNNDGFFDFPLPAVDAPCRTYQNVLFHDNYWQFINLIVHGESVGGAYIRELTNLDGGYDSSHSDVHLWYHGTADLHVPASDYAATITSAERQTWWTPYENYGVTAGFYYSLIGRGDRLATNQPVGSANSRVSDGFNQWWNFGAGVSNNRTALTENNGNWPNLIKINLTGSNEVAFGQSNTVKVFYQWAQPSFSNAAVNIYLDDDFNPYNGNERLLRQMTAAGTGMSQVASGNIGFGIYATNATTGFHAIYAEIKGGGRTRYIYAPEVLAVVSSLQGPTLELTLQSGSQTRVDVVGTPGQHFVLQSTTDLYSWQSIATNWLSTNRWTYIDTGASRKFYRVFLQ